MRFWRGKYTVVAETFRFQGRTYAKSDEFPWRKRAISEAAVRRLVAQGMVAPNTEDDRYYPADMPVVEQPEEEITEEIVAPIESFTYDPEVHDLQLPRRGHAHIFLGEEHCLTITRKEGKRLREVLEATEVEAEEIR